VARGRGWELGRESDPGLLDAGETTIALIEGAQRKDGYLNTYVQLSGREPYGDLQWGHELYCIGHLLQAAVAWQRSVGDERAMAVALRAVDHIEAALGEGRLEGMDGHPEIEMALVEAYRVTGQERLLAFARLQIERRGRGLLGEGRLGQRYWQDHEPVRTAPTPTGHAVRQLYLDCGAVDVAVETGDTELLHAVLRRWEDMWASRTYLTGALGSRHRDEAFGDPFELPSDRAYAETCAAIGSTMLAWRLLLATGEERFADAIERTLYNGVLPGLSLDGTGYFYSNPLHVRDRSVATGNAAMQRRPWYPCACCPPNIMRTLSSFEHVVATADDVGIQLHQLASGTIEVEHGGELVRLRIVSGQPWDGFVVIDVEAAPAEPWALALRVPAWLRSGTVRVGDETQPMETGSGRLELLRSWAAGDRVELDLELPVRMTSPDERIDAVRGCVALERGPLVYCLEAADLPHGLTPDDVELDADHEAVVTTQAPGLPAGTVSIEAAGDVRVAGSAGWPYAEVAAGGGPQRTATTLRAVPYFAWANRDPGPMRVWLPTRK
jgi:DUF1680 family protein